MAILVLRWERDLRRQTSEVAESSVEWEEPRTVQVRETEQAEERRPWKGGSGELQRKEKIGETWDRVWRNPTRRRNPLAQELRHREGCCKCWRDRVSVWGCPQERESSERCSALQGTSILYSAWGVQECNRELPETSYGPFSNRLQKERETVVFSDPMRETDTD